VKYDNQFTRDVHSSDGVTAYLLDYLVSVHFLWFIY